MRRVAVVLVMLLACKKQEKEPEPAPPPIAPSVGHSSTKLRDTGEAEARPGSGGVAHEATIDAGEPPDAQLYGGNGAPPYRDADGHIHGPGGPVYMGRGPDCTNKIDHCLRADVWFAVGDVHRGRLYRATPVFEFEDKWWNFRAQEQSDWAVLYRTKVVEKPGELRAGSPVIWLVEEASHKWLNSEHDALTSSRWEAGIIESVSGSSFKVAGWSGGIPSDTARVIIQQKKSP